MGEKIFRAGKSNYYKGQALIKKLCLLTKGDKKAIANNSTPFFEGWVKVCAICVLKFI